MAKRRGVSESPFASLGGSLSQGTNFQAERVISTSPMVPGMSTSEREKMLAAVRGSIVPQLEYGAWSDIFLGRHNRRGAEEATGRARAQRRSLQGRSLGGGGSRARGQSLLLSLLGLMNEPNTTTGQLGGGA